MSAVKHNNKLGQLSSLSQGGIQWTSGNELFSIFIQGFLYIVLHMNNSLVWLTESSLPLSGSNSRRD